MGNELNKSHAQPNTTPRTSNTNATPSPDTILAPPDAPDAPPSRSRRQKLAHLARNVGRVGKKAASAVGSGVASAAKAVGRVAVRAVQRGGHAGGKQLNRIGALKNLFTEEEARAAEQRPYVVVVSVCQARGLKQFGRRARRQRRRAARAGAGGGPAQAEDEEGEEDEEEEEEEDDEQEEEEDALGLQAATRANTFVSVRVGGVEKSSRVVKHSDNPVFNQHLRFEFSAPPRAAYLSVRRRRRVLGDEYIGVHKLDLKELWASDEAQGEWRWLKLSPVIDGDEAEDGEALSTGELQVCIACRMRDVHADILQEMSFTHVLVVRIVQAQDVPKRSKKREANPFVEINYAAQRYRTRTVRSSRNPVWDQTTIFWVNQDIVRRFRLGITLYSEQRVFTRVLGGAYVDLGDLFEHPDHPVIHGWVRLATPDQVAVSDRDLRVVRATSVVALDEGDEVDEAIVSQASAAAAAAALVGGSAGAGGGVVGGEEEEEDDEDDDEEDDAPHYDPPSTSSNSALFDFHVIRSLFELDGADSASPATSPEHAGDITTPRPSTPVSSTSELPEAPEDDEVSVSQVREPRVRICVHALSRETIEATFVAHLLEDFAQLNPHALTLAETHIMLDALRFASEDEVVDDLFAQYATPLGTVDADTPPELASRSCLGRDGIVLFLRALARRSVYTASRLLEWLNISQKSHVSTLMHSSSKARVRPSEPARQRKVKGMQFGQGASDTASVVGFKHIEVVSREDGLIVREEIPSYIAYALRLMFRSRLGRFFSSVVANNKLRVFEKMSVRRGRKLDDPASASKIAPFIKLHNINVDEIERPPREYRTFNEFFYRRLRPGARPLPADPHALLSPADCRCTVFQHMNDSTRVWIKGSNFTVENLLGPELAGEYADTFRDGAMMISRLAPQDYHRWHCPVTGMLGRRVDIDGTLVTVNPIAVNRDVDVYTDNKRVVCEIHSVHFGTVLLVAIGATMVGSIHITAPHGVDGAEQLIQAGDEHGYFAFGGSTVITLFEPGAVQFDSDLLHNSGQAMETLVKCNTQVGVANHPARGD